MSDFTDSALQSGGLTVGGVLAVLGSFSTKLYEWITHQDVNDFLQTVLAVGGIVFLVYKIQGQRLDNKKKQKELEK